MTNLTGRCLLPAIAVLLSLGAPAEAWASIPDSNGVYTGCVLRAINTVRLIDTSVTSQRCISSLEVQVTWSQKGPQGPAGAAGPQGAQGTAGLDGSNVTASMVDPLTDSRCGSLGGVEILQDGVSKAVVCSIEGPEGAQGIPGPAGPQGPKGDTGATGARGPKGDPGLAAGEVEPGLPAVAAGTMAFFRLDGYRGGSADDAHSDWSDVEGYSLGSTSLETATSLLRPKPNEVTVQLVNDAMLPILLEHVITGTHASEAVLDVWRTGGSVRGLPLFTIRFRDVAPSYITIGPRRALLGFAFGTAVVSYRPLRANGTLDAEVSEDLDVSSLAFGTGTRLAPSPRASPDQALFLQLAGVVGPLPLTSSHARWIPALSVSLTVTNDGVLTGRESGAGGSRPSFSALQVGKELDRTTPELLHDAMRAAHYSDARMELCTSDESECLLRIGLDDVYVSAVSLVSGAELLDLGYRRITFAMRATPTSTEYSYTYDLTTGRGSSTP